MARAYEAYLDEIARLVCAPPADRVRLMDGWRRELEETNPGLTDWDRTPCPSGRPPDMCAAAAGRCGWALPRACWR